ncbi:MAG: hypothetical protein JW881_05040 [Spirochaetales bacterium]|nr:hypothetical protein [Spirochaetales bacterium]
METRNIHEGVAINLPVLVIIGIILICITGLVITYVMKHPVPRTMDRKRKMKCPLCQSWLLPGERIRTESWPGKKDEKRVYLYGCRFCHGEKATVKKKCPVCKRQIHAGAYLIGRMWRREGKNRVHIEGCTVCLKIKTG